MSQSQAQPLASSSSKIALSSQNTVVLPNLSYPSRSYSDISWSRSLDPKRFSKDVDLRSPPTLAFSYASATATTSNTVTTNTDDTDSDLSSVTHALRGIRGLIWLLVKKLIGPTPTP